MAYGYYDHRSDIGITSTGENLREVFADGAKALFDIMVEIKTVKPIEKISVMCSSKDKAGLFVEWLNELIFQKDVTGMVFSKFKIEEIINKNDIYELRAIIWGEKLNPAKHQIKVEAKGATFSQLSVKQKQGSWEAKCIIDV